MASASIAVIAFGLIGGSAAAAPTVKVMNDVAGFETVAVWPRHLEGKDLEQITMCPRLDFAQKNYLEANGNSPQAWAIVAETCFSEWKPLGTLSEAGIIALAEKRTGEYAPVYPELFSPQDRRGDATATRKHKRKHHRGNYRSRH